MKSTPTSALVADSTAAAPAASAPTAPEPAAPQSSTFAALRHRNFRLYAIGMLVSMAGSWMQIIAQGWLVYQISQSESTLGLVGFASAIPALLVLPWAGVLIDRSSKRRILIITQIAAMLCALILAALTLTGRVQVWHIILLAVGIGFVNAFDNPTRQAFVVEMVGREDLPNAIALNSMIFNGARIVGPAFGGVLLALVGAGWCFLINGLSFVAVIVALFAMELTPWERRVRIDSPWDQMKDGLLYVRRHVDMRTLLIQSLIFSVFGISYSTVLPAYVDEVLNVGAATYGMIQAASGVGAVTAAFLIARYGGIVPRGRWLMSAALIFPLVLAAFAWSRSLALSLGLAFFLGMGFLSQFALLNTLLQTHVEDGMRGRLMSLYTLTFNGFAPFGNLAIGQLSERWGLSLALSTSAGITFAFSALNLLGRNGVRRMK